MAWCGIGGSKAVVRPAIEYNRDMVTGGNDKGDNGHFMVRKTIRRFWLGTAVLVCGAADAADWPAWRGSDRTGRSLETGLADSWPDEGPALLWQIDSVGVGFSSPSIARQRIYLMGNSDGGEWIYCLDARDDGALVWAYRVGDVRHNGAGYEGPRSTPTVDGDRVYAVGLNGDVVCLTSENGRARLAP